MSQLMRKDCRKKNDHSSNDDDEARRPIFEMTTSGMTHSWGGLSTPIRDDPNFEYTLGEQVKAFIRSVTMHAMHAFRPWTSLLMSSDETPRTMNLPSRGPNGYFNIRCGETLENSSLIGTIERS
jgi:hypothetical protein